MSKYLSDFRNVILTITGINDGEIWDRFCSGLKYKVRLEVMKSTVATFEEATKIDIRVYSTLWTVGRQKGE